MASHSTIRNYEEDFSFMDSDEEVEYSAEYNRLDQILERYGDSQYPDTGELRRLLDDVTDDEKMRLLERHETLETAALSDHSEMISTILSSLSPHQRLEVISVGYMLDMTPLHWATGRGNTDSVKLILSQLTSEQQLTLLSMRDVLGHTPADWASVCGKKEIERLLRDYKQRANQQTEAVTRHENLPVTREDLAAALCRIKKLEDRLQVQQNNSAEVFASYEDLLVRHGDLTAGHEDLAAGCVSALDRIRELEDQLRAQQNNSAEVFARYENLLVMHEDLTARHEDLAVGCASALDRIRELEDQLCTQQNNSAGHGCSSITQQTSNGLDQMVYDVIATHERDNEGWQALRQMVLNNSAGLATLRDLTQENRNALTAQGLREADTEQPEDNQSEDEDTEHPHMDGNDAEENET